jgi:HK97 gp10 family phage protein
MATAVTFIPNPALEAEWYSSAEANLMMTSIGEQIRSIAKGLCPVDTGLLASSIESFVGFSEMGRLEVMVGSSVRYAGFVEFGTSKMAAQPYLRPALDSVM